MTNWSVAGSIGHHHAGSRVPFSNCVSANSCQNLRDNFPDPKGVRPTDTVRPLQCGMTLRFVNTPICLTRIYSRTLQRRLRIRDTPRRL